MTNKERHILDCLRNGESATLTSVAGTTCPCITAKGSYSLQWHRDNPGSANCSGKGIISTTTATTSIKMLVCPVQFIGTAGVMNKEQLKEIGEVQDCDLVVFGACDTNGTEIDLSVYDEKNDKITYLSQDYVIRHYFKSDFLSVGLLKRIA